MYRGNAQTQAKVILNHEWTRKNAKRFSYWFTTSQGSEPDCDPWRGIDDTCAALTAVKITTGTPVDSAHSTTAP